MRELSSGRLAYEQADETVSDAVLTAGGDALFLVRTDGRLQKRTLTLDQSPWVDLPVTNVKHIALSRDGRWTLAVTSEATVVIDNRGLVDPWTLQAPASRSRSVRMDRVPPCP
ncbi:MAG: hypothetical protein ABIQ06_00095 [Caldimonas sp.]